MKIHNYTKLEFEQSPTGKWWRYDVTACGLRRQQDDYHIDAAKTPEEITCLKCKAQLQKRFDNARR